MKYKFLGRRGFTLVEALTALTLLGFLMLAVTGIVAFASEAAATERIEESLHSVAISTIENKRYTLQTAHTLPCGREVSTGEIGNIEYVIICNTEALNYVGAYRLRLIIKSNNGVNISNEVILYA